MKDFIVPRYDNYQSQEMAFLQAVRYGCKDEDSKGLCSVEVQVETLPRDWIKKLQSTLESKTKVVHFGFYHSDSMSTQNFRIIWRDMGVQRFLHPQPPVKPAPPTLTYRMVSYLASYFLDWRQRLDEKSLC
jgi:hypothetical protein